MQDTDWGYVVSFSCFSISASPLLRCRPAADVSIPLTEEEAKEKAKAATESSMDVDVQCQEMLRYNKYPACFSKTYEIHLSLWLLVGHFRSIPPANEFGAFRLRPAEFDKDQDHHMRVVAACSNLRARNYRIPEAGLVCFGESY